MKKLTIPVLFMLLLLMCGCAVQPAAFAAQITPTPAITPTPEPLSEPLPTPTPLPSPTSMPEPETEKAFVIALEAPVILTRLERDTEVELMGKDSKFPEFYIVKSEDGYGLMHRQFLRLEDAKEFESWTFKADAGLKLYSGYTMKDEKPELAEKGVEVKVIEKLDTCYVVMIGDKVGVVAAEDINGKGKASWGAVGEGGGGDVGGGGWNGIPQDGNDILIAGRIGAPRAKLEKLATVIKQEDTVITGKASVIINEAPVIGAIYERGEDVRVFEWGDETTVLYVLGFYGETQTRFLRAEKDKEYTSWICYSKQGTKLFDNIEMRAPGFIPLNRNVEMTVLEDMGDCYLVETENGMGYVEKDDISKDKLSSFDYGGGGGDVGGGGFDAGWTAPAF